MPLLCVHINISFVVHHDAPWFRQLPGTSFSHHVLFVAPVPYLPDLVDVEVTIRLIIFDSIERFDNALGHRKHLHGLHQFNCRQFSAATYPPLQG